MICFNFEAQANKNQHIVYLWSIEKIHVLLIAGTDTSGSEVVGQRKFISLVVGKDETLNAMFNRIGLRQIHMIRLEENEQNHVIDTLRFSADVAAWCLTVDKQRIIDYIFHHEQLNNKHKPKVRISAHFDRLVLRHIREELQVFLQPHRMEIEQINIEYDADMSETIKIWRMNPKMKGRVHQIADAIAWANYRGRTIRGCRELDLSEELKQQMEYDLLK